LKISKKKYKILKISKKKYKILKMSKKKYKFFKIAKIIKNRNFEKFKIYEKYKTCKIRKIMKNVNFKNFKIYEKFFLTFKKYELWKIQNFCENESFSQKFGWLGKF